MTDHSQPILAGVDTLHKLATQVSEHSTHNDSFAHDSLWTGQDLIYNLLDHPLDFLPHLQIGNLDLSLTKHSFIFVIASIVLLIVASLAGNSAKKNYGKAPKGIGNFFEVFVKFIRNEVVYPAMGDKLGRHLLNYFLTVFFFILFGNLSGLIPGSKSPTMNIAATMGLSLMTFVLMIYGGIKSHGFWGFLKHFAPPGIPPFVYIILTPIEIVGVFIKPFALTIRLFANMVAGKALVLSFIGLIFMLAIGIGAGGAFTLGLLPFFGGLGIMVLEVFIAFLQAFIFTMLSALFIGQLAAHHEDEHHEEHQEHANL